MKLIVITPSRTSEKEIVQIVQMFENGLTTLHIRKPNMSTKEMKDYIEKIPKQFHDRIVIHSHHKLALKYDLRGIHMTRSHLKNRLRTWWRLRLILARKPDTTVTSSFRKIGNIYENDHNYRYVLIGTIFDRVSGKFNSGYNEHSLRAGIARSTNPLIARGGTNADNIAKCNELGFAGIAFYGSIWKAEDPVNAFDQILERYRELGITVA